MMLAGVGKGNHPVREDFINGRGRKYPGDRKVAGAGEHLDALVGVTCDPHLALK